MGPCLTCKNIKGPIISQLPCLRYKISDISLFTKGHHPRFIWTHRWKSMKLVEIGEWQSHNIKEVEITQDVGGAWYKLHVREFIPIPGDSLERKWKTKGVQLSYPCTPYAIADMHETIQELNRYVHDTVTTSIEEFTDETDNLLRQTYVMAHRFSQITQVSNQTNLRGQPNSFRRIKTSKPYCTTFCFCGMPYAWNQGLSSSVAPKPWVCCRSTSISNATIMGAFWSHQL